METALTPPERRVIEYIRKYDMLRVDQSVLVGLSGGPDSVCLLHIILRLKNELGITVSALHVEHGIRGDSSIGDMEFCRALCCDWDIPLYIERANVPALADERRVSIEVAARDVRKAASARVMAENGIDHYATGHHADDQLETMLLHMARGSGLNGMRGMLPVSGKTIRPLLCLEKQDIVTYLDDIGISYRTDETNADLFTPRNALRAVVLPVIYGINPKAGVAAVRLSDALREDAEALDALAHNVFEDRFKDNALDVSAWEGIPAALRKRVLAQCVCGWGGSVESARLNALDGMVLSGGRGLSLDGVTVYLRDNKLFKDEKTVPIDEISLPFEGKVLVNGVSIETCIADRPADVRGNANEQYFDWDAVCEKTLSIRSAKPGERIRVFGSGKHKLISDIFTDMKIPAACRPTVPLLCADGRCIWLMGLRRADFGEIGDSTRRILMVKYMDNG